GQIREVMATHKEAEDLINIGAYVEGSNGKIDYAISRIEAVREFLCQGMDEAVDLEQTLAELTTLILDRRQQAR
ncbi:MAG: flagellum-specific ATP synthase FliI, partial [Desulfuromonadales bacterium]|nr:flagellum-specific ATP synthase FliI [Desulfuromonadales bacterium]